jgi:hypothetical protein
MKKYPGRFSALSCDVMRSIDRMNEKEEEEEKEETSSMFRRLRNGNISCPSLLSTINFRMIAIC